MEDREFCSGICFCCHFIRVLEQKGRISLSRCMVLLHNKNRYLSIYHLMSSWTDCFDWNSDRTQVLFCSHGRLISPLFYYLSLCTYSSSIPCLTFDLKNWVLIKKSCSKPLHIWWLVWVTVKNEYILAAGTAAFHSVGFSLSGPIHHLLPWICFISVWQLALESTCPIAYKTRCYISLRLVL